MGKKPSEIIIEDSKLQGQTQYTCMGINCVCCENSVTLKAILNYLDDQAK